MKAHSDQITSETAQLIAYQVGRAYALKTKHFSVEEPDPRLSLLCARLTKQSAKYTIPGKLLRETAEVGGPRWRIGWGGVT